MTHLDEGQLRTLLDDELFEGDDVAAREHVAECVTCQALMAELNAAHALVGAAIGLLDSAPVPVGAKTAVLARVGGGGADTPSKPTLEASPDISPARPVPSRRGTERVAFARAAMFVLFFGAVVATALPASPVRGWMAEGWNQVIAILAPTQDEPSVASPVSAAPQVGASGGVRLEVAGGALEVLLQDIAPGTELSVLLVDGFQAGAFAAEPARFRTADGLIEVTGASGTVRVDVPRSVEVASIRVNGRMYMTKTGVELDVAGPIVTRTPDEIRLRVQ